MPYTRRLSVQDIELVRIVGTQTGTVAASGGAETFSLLAPVGYIYRLQNIYVNIPDPTGSGSGTHYIYLQYSGTPGISVMYITSATGTGIQLDYRHARIKTSVIPVLIADQIAVLQNLVCDADVSLDFRYTNNTNVDQTTDRTYIILAEKIKVV